MFRIKTGIEVQLAEEKIYKNSYEKAKDISALHKYIACLLQNKKYADCDQKQKQWLQNELKKYLHCIVHTKNAKPYEALFYFELNHAFGDYSRINNWLSLCPWYEKHCNLCIQSYEFLAYVGLIEAASKCLNELYYTGVIDHSTYIKYKCQFFRKYDKKEEFRFLEKLINDSHYNVSKRLAERYVCCGCSLNQRERALSFLKQGLLNNLRAKWINYYYVKLCLEMGMFTEGKLQAEKLINTAIFIHEGDKVNSATIKELAENYVLIYSLLKDFDNTFEDKKGLDFITINYPEIIFDCFQNRFQLTDFNLLNKEFMNQSFDKILRSEKFINEMLYIKSILLSFLSLIRRRFYKKLGLSKFEIPDYKQFYDVFPFYNRAEFNKNEIKRVIELLQEIETNCVRLEAPLRIFMNVSPLLHELLSKSVQLQINKKIHKYLVSVNGKITFFGVIVFLSTFLDTQEKRLFAHELSKTDFRLQRSFFRQFLQPIDSALNAISEISEIEHDRKILTVLILEELNILLLEIKQKLLIKQHILVNGPFNNYAKTIKQKIPKLSLHYSKVDLLDRLVNGNLLIGERDDCISVSIENIIKILVECRDTAEEPKMFQQVIERVFVICMNRKYYNQFKWEKTYSEGNFLADKEKHYNKLLYYNKFLVTKDDENILYKESLLHLLAPINMAQQNEFVFIFGSSVLFWGKATIKLYIIDLAKCSCLLDGNEVTGQYVMLGEKETLDIQGKDDWSFNGWKDTELFNSNLSMLITKRPLFKERL